MHHIEATDTISCKQNVRILTTLKQCMLVLVAVRCQYRGSLINVLVYYPVYETPA